VGSHRRGFYAGARVAVLWGLVAACKRDGGSTAATMERAPSAEGNGGPFDARCQRALAHLEEVWSEGSAPVERVIIHTSFGPTIARCKREGLGEEQAACILALQHADDLLHLGECPAIRASPPAWLPLIPTGPR
jgi:hypothetical protein